MSENALREAHEVDREQAHRNDARRILQRVVLALKSQQSSGVRWPFELLQNAHDFGAREGRTSSRSSFASTTKIWLFPTTEGYSAFRNSRRCCPAVRARSSMESKRPAGSAQGSW